MNPANSSEQIEKVRLPLLKKDIYEIDIDSIVYLQSDGVVSRLIALNGKTTYTKVINTTLNRLEKQLSPRGFCRIHRSVLVNLKHVNDYGEYPQMTIDLTSGDSLPVAKRRKLDLHTAYLKYTKY